MVLAAAAATVTACTMKSQEAPPLAGPSEFAQSITVSVSPDVLSQDGVSQSAVTIQARGVAGEPLRNLSFRNEIYVGGTPVDFGLLSARNVVTGNDGRATFAYTAPPAPPVTADNFTIVSIRVTPVGTDFNNSSSRSASIRLVPPGIIVPNDGLAPYFTFTPSQPQDNQPVLFDACNDSTRSCAPANNPIVSYSWSFGDGGGGSGKTTSRAYSLPGTYVVRLTVTDGFGRSASTSQSLTVGAGIGPTAAFVFSPTNPQINQAVNFNGSGSTAAPGRRIVSYAWDFGDGSGLSAPGASPTISRVYSLPRTYTVTLVVTDDAGRTGAISQTVDVLPPS